MDIVKTFHSNKFTKDITIIGTPENPLFKAVDVAELLEMSNIRVVLADFDDTEKCVNNSYTVRGYKDVNFLTEKGLYKLLFRSRKSIAVQFTNWVCEVIKQIRLNGVYQLEQQLKEKQEEMEHLSQQNQQLLEQIENIKPGDGRPVIYIYDMNSRAEPQANGKKSYKIGMTDNLHRRIKPYKQISPYGKVAFYVHIDAENLRTTESWIHMLMKSYKQGGEVFEISLELAKKFVMHVANTLEIVATNNKDDMEAMISKVVDLESSVLSKECVGIASRGEVSTQTEQEFLDASISDDEIEEDPKGSSSNGNKYTEQFNAFIDKCCLLDVTYEVSSKDVIGQYRLWSHIPDKNAYYALNDYLRTRFRPIRLHEPNKKQNVHGFRGLKLKEQNIPSLPFAPSDPELFIAHSCVYTPSGKVLMKNMLEEYEKWGKSVNKDVNSKDIKEYLKKNSEFILVGNVWTEKGNGQGYYGICFKSDIENYAQVRTVGKTVTKYDQQGNIVATWDTIAKAAADEGMAPCKLSHIIKDKKKLNGFKYSAAYKN
jgi:prophage antirepressor-like protein